MSDGFINSLLANPRDDMGSLALTLSTALDATVLSTMAFDSDLGCLSVADKGQLVGQLGTLSEQPSARPEPAILRALARDPKQVDALAAIWRSDESSRCDCVIESAQLLGLDTSLVLSRPHGVASLEGVALLRITPPRRASVGAGTPSLEIASVPQPEFRMVPGYEMSLPITLMNKGSSSRGLMVEVSGPALQLIRVDRGRARVLGKERASAPFSAVSNITHRAQFDQLAIEAAAPPGFRSGGDPRSRIQLHLEIEAIRVGCARLKVCIGAGAANGASTEIEIRVIESGWLPPESALALDLPAVLTRAWDPIFVSAWIIAGGKKGTTIAPIIAAAAKHFARALPGPTALRSSRLGSRRYPTLEQFDIGELDESKLRALLRSADALRIERPLDPARERSLDSLARMGDIARATGPSDGIFIAKKSFIQPNEPIAVHAAFWSHAASRSRTDVDAVERGLIENIDEIARLAPIRQAFVTRCADDTQSFATTPYEHLHEVCGHPQSIGWVDTHLRSVERQLWIGPELQRHLDRRAIERMAHVKDVGQCWHVECAPECLSALDAALRPVLPRATPQPRR